MIEEIEKHIDNYRDAAMHPVVADSKYRKLTMEKELDKLSNVYVTCIKKIFNHVAKTETSEWVYSIWSERRNVGIKLEKGRVSIGPVKKGEIIGGRMYYNTEKNDGVIKYLAGTWPLAGSDVNVDVLDRALEQLKKIAEKGITI